MTFLHKLARRLARLKARTLIAAAAVSAAAGILGCEQPRGSTEPITPTVSQLVVSPKTVTLQPDQLQDFMAVGLTSTGDTAQVDVTWSASGGSVTQKATRGGRHYGQYKTGLCGTYTVTATANPGNKSDNASVAVTCTGTVASVVVSPAAASLAAGGTVQLTATPLDTSGNVMTGSAVSWSSGTPAVATVDGTGLATGVAAGSAAITATSGGKSGTATLTVTTPGGSTTPGAVTNLVVAGTTDNAVTLSFTEVSD